MYVYTKKKKLLAFTIHFWLKASRKKNNTKNDNKYSNIYTR